jgi:glycosyltransferase involved in cell wall biosynthesis
VTQLSILVPAYNYPRGLERILHALTPLPTEVELIVADDSPGTSVRDIVLQYAAENIVYRKNSPAKGAVANWNGLLETAQGEFAMVLHHDEIPLGAGFIDRILTVLKRTSSDVLMMDVLLLDTSMVPIRRHVPRTLRDFVIRYVPGYLFCRSVIGPTASLVVRSTAYPRFDTSLKWLVDVDLYYRLRQKTKGWETVKGLEMGSVQGDHDSITQTLQSQLTKLELAERARLSAAHPEASFWINMQRKPLIGTLEAVVWGGFRAVQAVLFKLRTSKRLSQ